jgi:ADP-heptose:LPS heptosyltransferase
MQSASVLVYVGLDRFGDGVMKLPFLRALRASWPQARITWLAGKGPSAYAGVLRPLVAGLADEVIDDAHIGLAAAELLRRPLPGRRFDLVLDTQRRVLTTLILRRIAHGRFVSGAAAWLLSDARPPDRTKPASMIGQMMRLIEAAAGGRVDPLGARIVVPEAIEARARQLLPDGPAYVGLMPGAGDRRKCWPLDRFIALARQLPAPVMLLGPDERDWVADLRAALPGVPFPLQDAGDGPLMTVALGRRLAAAVANDAGMGHLLAAADCPMVSLFGPTPSAKFAPFAARLEVVEAGRFGNSEMSAIPPDAVAAAIQRLVKG